MARRYSRARGKSGSKKPVNKKLPSWVRYNSSEVEKLIVKLGKSELSSAQIGLVLRDSYGVPLIKSATKKSVSKILDDNGIKRVIPEDLTALIRKNIRERKHFESNRQDMVVKRGLIITESKIRRLVKYYKRVGKLAVDWKFDPKRTRLVVE